MANNNEYNDYSDIYSAKSENTNTSIRNSKLNRYVLDNNMNWYIFEDSVKLGIDFLDKYKNSIFHMAKTVNINKDYFMRPEYVSYVLYQTTDLWYILLWLNNMKNPNEFVKDQIIVIDPNRLSDFQKIMDEGRRHVRNVFNAKPLQKHYLKHPNLVSNKLLPDSYNDNLYNTGFVGNYKEINFIENLLYMHNPNDYYHGKSKMTEIEVEYITNISNEKSISYMDGIQISNVTNDPIFDKTNNEKEYVFTGYMHFPYEGKYDFQLNGINGEANLEIDGVFCKDENGEANISLPEINKKFDFFELKTKNSDFKKRNWTGWDYHHPKVRLVTDPDKKKPVAKAVISDNKVKDFFPNNSTECKLFYNTMVSEELDINLEPLNDGKKGKIIFSCEMKTNGETINVNVEPYLTINYKDETTETTFLNKTNVGSLWSTSEYEKLIVTLTIDPTKLIKNIEFGVMTKLHNFRYDDTFAEISINEVSINFIEFNDISIVIPKENRNKWLPFKCIYKYNKNDMKMFYVKRKFAEFSENFKFIDKDQIAFIPNSTEKIINDAVLVTISNEYNLESCYLQHNLDKEVLIENGKKSTISYKTCLTINDSSSKYRIKLDKLEKSPNAKIEIYLDDVLVAISSQNDINNKEIALSFSQFYNPSFNKEIETSGYRLANLEIFIKNVLDDKIRIEMAIEEDNEYQKLTDDYFSIDSYKLFKCLYLKKDLSSDKDIYIANTMNILKEYNKDQINESLTKEDTIFIESDNNYKMLNVFKPGILTLKESIFNKECDNYIIEFDIVINSNQNGLFIINLDEQNNGNKYGLIFNYKTPYSNYPKFTIKNGLYTNTLKKAISLNNIDSGIDFYKHNYEEIKIYKNIAAASSMNSIKRFEIIKGESYHIKIQKKKNFLNLKINGENIAVWHDYDKAYSDGLCGFTFVNLNNVRITNLNLYC